MVLGAIFTSIMFWRLPDGSGRIDMASILLLGITTWTIYILDRILDLKVYPKDFSERHAFHAKNQYNLSILLIALIVTGTILSFLIPYRVLLYGAALSLFLVIYFVILNKFMKNSKFQWLKEPVTAIGYTLAVVGIAFVYQSSINLSGWVLAFLLFLVASQNLLVFSYFENLKNQEIKNSVSSFGAKWTLRFIRMIGVVTLLLVLILFSGGFGYPNRAAFVIALMSQVLSFLPSKSEYMIHKSRYRWLGDGVFLLPVILLFF